MVYAFVALVDPWNILPLSPPLPRVPISTNARFSFPALARDRQFDSIVLGTSTSRLLQPARLNPLFGIKAANLAMNSATAWEQSRMLQVFLWRHPAPRLVMIGLDMEWCRPAEEDFDLTSRPFPEWMYRRTTWAGYLHLLDGYAVQEAGNQFAVLAHLKRRRYGLDGYTSFLPDDGRYDADRALVHINEERASDAPEQVPGWAAGRRFPAHARLRDAMAAIPAATAKVLFFVPYHIALQGRPGTLQAALLAECKRRITAVMADVPNATLADFMIPSSLTRLDTNYWDAHHYRAAIADEISQDLVRAVRREPVEGDEMRLLVP